MDPAANQPDTSHKPSPPPPHEPPDRQPSPYPPGFDINRVATTTTNADGTITYTMQGPSDPKGPQHTTTWIESADKTRWTREEIHGTTGTPHVGHQYILENNQWYTFHPYPPGFNLNEVTNTVNNADGSVTYTLRGGSKHPITWTENADKSSWTEAINGQERDFVLDNGSWHRSNPNDLHNKQDIASNMTGGAAGNVASVAPGGQTDTAHGPLPPQHVPPHEMPPEKIPPTPVTGGGPVPISATGFQLNDIPPNPTVQKPLAKFSSGGDPYGPPTIDSSARGGISGSIPPQHGSGPTSMPLPEYNPNRPPATGDIPSGTPLGGMPAMPGATMPNDSQTSHSDGLNTGTGASPIEAFGLNTDGNQPPHKA